jgi:hypothetical protein
MFLGSFLPFWIRTHILNADPDLDLANQINADQSRIWIRNPAVSFTFRYGKVQYSFDFSLQFGTFGTLCFVTASFSKTKRHKEVSRNQGFSYNFSL